KSPPPRGTRSTSERLSQPPKSSWGSAMSSSCETAPPESDLGEMLAALAGEGSGIEALLTGPGALSLTAAAAPGFGTVGMVGTDGTLSGSLLLAPVALGAGTFGIAGTLGSAPNTVP